MTDLNSRIAALPPEKRLLLEMRRKEKQRREAAVTPFSLISPEDRERVPEEVEDAYPMVSMQLGMVHHMHMTAANEVPSYHNVFVYRLRFQVDQGRLKTALEALIQRHAILRTSFNLTRYSEPMQEVHREVEVPLALADLLNLTPEEEQNQLQRLLKRENQRLLDLAQAPLMRFFVLRCSDGDYLVITECHAIAEGWGTLRTLAEIRENYFHLVERGSLPDQSPLATQFRDFVRLEKQALESEETRTFWKEQLDRFEPLTVPTWPKEYRRPHRSAGSKMYFWHDSERVRKLELWAAKEGIPFKSVLLAAHLKVMGMVSGQQRVVTGLHIHGRPETEDGERVLGLFNNTLPFQGQVATGTWAQLIHRTFEAETELMPHRRYPLAALQRQWGQEPLVETAFVFLRYHLFGEYQEWTGAPIEDLEDTDLTVSHFPLASVFSSWGSTREPRLLHLVEFDDTRIHRAQAEAVRRYFIRILDAIARDPNGSIAAVSFLSPVELHQVLVEWNDGIQLRDPALEGAHQLFQRAAVANPGATAIVFGDENLSYSELDRRSTALAAHLLRSGLQVEERVGIFMKSCPEMVVALLAILKAGGAFLCLEPDLPLERAEFMVRDAEVRRVLTARGSGEAIPATFSSLAVDELNLDETAHLPDQSDRNRLAYVIYTSGSTGKPKGVLLHHGGLINLALAQTALFGIGSQDRILQFASLSFDASVSEIFMALSQGAALILEPKEALLPQASLVRLLEDRGVTAVTLPPAALAVLPEATLPKLRCLIVAGEACPMAVVDRWAPGRQFFNAYGPTEITVCASAQRCREDGSKPAIGRPLDNVQTYVLDAAGFPLPVGVPGELYVGGAGVARGYARRPALTAAHFLPDPFAAGPGERLYRTGDRVRLLPDGRLDFLGRVDNQVKVRGFRIEMGEVETTLVQHEGIRMAVVTTYDDGGGDRLVAYLQARGEERPTIGGLRSFLRRSLPEYMVPSFFEFLDTIPVNNSGKVDRRALPAPRSVRPEVEATFQAARSEMEKNLAQVWREILGLDRVGIQDNFFELGGDSLRLVRLNKQVEEIAGRPIPVADLFRYPTISALAAHLGTGDVGPSVQEVAQERVKARQGAAAHRRQQMARRRNARRGSGGTGEA